MTKKQAKIDLSEAIDNLQYQLKNYCDNSSEYDNAHDFLDLVNANNDTRETYNNLSLLQSAFNLPTPRTLRKLVRYYENQLKDYHRNDEIIERIYKFFTNLGFNTNEIDAEYNNMPSNLIEEPKKNELKIIYYLQNQLIKK